MSSLDYIKKLYNPYRYTLNKSVTIIDSTSGKFVIKKQNKDLFSLFNYLNSRGFTAYPEIIRNYCNEENIFEFIEDEHMPKEQKMQDFADTLAALHNKTVYYKNTSLDDYKKIKENVENNISYLQNYYDMLFNNILLKEYQSPSEYLFARNYFKIKECLNFCASEINTWFDLVSENKRERVAVVHNNLSLEHYKRNYNRDAFISWDNYKIDTPVLDFVKLYQTNYLDIDFSTFLTRYLNHFELLDYEKKLLFVLISLPMQVEFGDNEYKNCETINGLITYVYQTEELIRPYYATQKEEE